MALQIRHLLREVRWPDGDRVFCDRVYVAGDGVPSDADIPRGFPFAIVQIAGGTPDENDPELIEQNFSVVAVAQVMGDTLGESAIIGRTRDMTRSGNAGAAELGERVRSALERLTGSDGAIVRLQAVSTDPIRSLESGVSLGADTVGFTAMCTSGLHYAAPQHVRFVGQELVWEGGQCSSRFDFVQYRVGTAGGSPAASPDDVDEFLYVGKEPRAPLPGGAGLVSVFADYNAFGCDSVEGSSRGDELGAYLTV